MTKHAKKRTRGRPAKSMPSRIKASPHKIADALFTNNDEKLKKHKKTAS